MKHKSGYLNTVVSTTELIPLPKFTLNGHGELMIEWTQNPLWKEITLNPDEVEALRRALLHGRVSRPSD